MPASRLALFLYPIGSVTKRSGPTHAGMLHMLGIFLRVARKLPSEVGKCFVRLRHAMHLILLLDRIALALSGSKNLVRELDRHRTALLIPRCADDPAEREREAAGLRHFSRHLVVGAADAAGTYLHQGRDVAD